MGMMTMRKSTATAGAGKTRDWRRSTNRETALSAFLMASVRFWIAGSARFDRGGRTRGLLA